MATKNMKRGKTDESSSSSVIAAEKMPVLPLGLFVPLERKKGVQSIAWEDYEFTVPKPIVEMKHIVHDFVPFEIEVPVKPPFRVLRFDLDVEKIKIEHSSNGLLLCQGQKKMIVQHRRAIAYKYYVYNPSINQFTTLPNPEYYLKSKHLGMTIAYDPSKSPHYKIIFVSSQGSDIRFGTSYMIEIYSSETQTCKPIFPFTLDEEYDIYFAGGVYWNNAVHWHHDSGFILYFKLDKEVLGHMYCPFHLLGVSHERYCGYMYESRGRLLVVEIPHPPDNVRYKIHELKKDYSGWIMKYRVDLEQVSRSFPEIISTTYRAADGSGFFHYTLLSLVLGEKDEDSFLVLQIPKKAIRFNIVSRTCHKLLDFTGEPRSIRSFDFDGIYVHKPNTFQFAESLCSV
ncbi:F-box protein At5g07610-like [Rutidosis leptorrhynchoides]|uniref:F-box protein At5g07610-like n=1 Tax=Rutidosis leptorrhynchoides TaxID=125765 RepID=UPI003A99FA99